MDNADNRFNSVNFIMIRQKLTKKKKYVTRYFPDNPEIFLLKINLILTVWVGYFIIGRQGPKIIVNRRPIQTCANWKRRTDLICLVCHGNCLLATLE